MTCYLASDTQLSDISHLPWWAQLAIGIGLMLLAVALDKAEDRLESDLLGMAAFAAGLAGCLVTLAVLF